MPDVMLEMSDVMSAFTGPLMGSHRTGRHPDGKRQHSAHKRKPHNHHPSALSGPNSTTDVSAGIPHAMTIFRLELLLSASEWLATLYVR